jgi:hypothetical protein
MRRNSHWDRPARHKGTVLGLLGKGYLSSKFVNNKLAKAEPPAWGVSLVRIKGPTTLKVAFKRPVMDAPCLVRSNRVNIFTNSPKIPDIHLLYRSAMGIGGYLLRRKYAHLFVFIYHFAIAHSYGDTCHHWFIKGERYPFPLR